MHTLGKEITPLILAFPFKVTNANVKQKCFLRHCELYSITTCIYEYTWNMYTANTTCDKMKLMCVFAFSVLLQLTPCSGD